MKNNQTSKNEKHQHAVIVCSIIHQKGLVHSPFSIDFKLNDLVCFCLENGDLKFGRVVRIQTDIGIVDKGKKQFVTYTIEDENGTLFERSASEIKR